MYHRPVCVKCQVELRPEKTGVTLVDMFQKPPKPYSIWSADKWKCPICGYEVVIGFGASPLYVHSDDKFKEMLKKAKESSKSVIYNYER